MAAAQLAYSVPQVPGLKLRADVKYTGNTMLGASNRVQVDDYAIVNIGATYDTQIHGYEATFTAGINNVANKRYWLYQSSDYVKAGDPRTYGSIVHIQISGYLDITRDEPLGGEHDGAWHSGRHGAGGPQRGAGADPGAGPRR